MKNKKLILTLEEEQLIFARANVQALGVYEFYKDYLVEVNKMALDWFTAGKPMKEFNQLLQHDGARLVAQFDQERAAAMAHAGTLN